jgi:hypothetical protein
MIDISNGRILKCSDSLNATMRDEADICQNKYPSIGGLVLVKNRRGDVLLRKNNLVVFRGRLFALEKIFGQPFNTPFSFMPNRNAGNERGSNPETISSLTNGVNIGNDLRNLLNRKVCLFSIGEGGVATNAWFSPSVVPPTSTALTQRIAFCDTASSDYLVNTNFYHAEELAEGAESSKCYYKRLNTKDAGDNFLPHWVFDTTTNTLAMMTTLHINESYLSNPSDGQIKRINELALYMANESENYTQLTPNVSGIGDYTVGTTIPNDVYILDDGVYTAVYGEFTEGVTYFKKGPSTFTDIEMFSRITFDTESLYANKELIIEYYIFA